jgi:hypothetical protein
MPRLRVPGRHMASSDDYAKHGLLAIASLRFQAFEAKFGRSPKPDDPLFFDESKDTPIKASLADTCAQLEEGARRAGVNVDPILRFLGLAPIERTSCATQTQIEERPHLQPCRAERRPIYGWEQFLADRTLHLRHGITQTELRAMSEVAFLGSARSARDYLLILDIIRQTGQN